MLYEINWDGGNIHIEADSRLEALSRAQRHFTDQNEKVPAIVIHRVFLELTPEVAAVVGVDMIGTLPGGDDDLASADVGLPREGKHAGTHAKAPHKPAASHAAHAKGQAAK